VKGRRARAALDCRFGRRAAAPAADFGRPRRLAFSDGLQDGLTGRYLLPNGQAAYIHAEPVEQYRLATDEEIRAVHERVYNLRHDKSEQLLTTERVFHY
jgi:hypothetical protein